LREDRFFKVTNRDVKDRTWFEIRRVPAVSIHQRGKSNSIKDLLLKIARGEDLEISEGDATPFSFYASAWLERKKATLARSTYGDYRSIWKRYVFPHFGNMPLCWVTRIDVEEFLANLPDISVFWEKNREFQVTLPDRTRSQNGSLDTEKMDVPLLEASAASSPGVYAFSTESGPSYRLRRFRVKSLVRRWIRNQATRLRRRSTMTYPRFATRENSLIIRTTASSVK